MGYFRQSNPEDRIVNSLNKSIPGRGELPAARLNTELGPGFDLLANDNIINFPSAKSSENSDETSDTTLARGIVSALHPTEQTWNDEPGNKCGAALQRAKAAARQSALLVFRLGEYRRMVETFGFGIGSTLKRLVAERLQDCLRVSDALDSIAEDEFVTLLDHFERVEDVAIVAERLIAQCTGCYVIDGLLLHIQATVGIALCPTDAESLSELVRYAQIALRQADTSSVAPYSFFSSDQLEQLREQISMTYELEQALVQDRLVLHYQPQYEVSSQRIVGMEALVRLESEAGELIFPDRFIDVAEDNGLIIPLGHWVIREACQQLRRWRDQGFGPLRMAINLSLSQLLDPQLMDVIREAIEGAGLDYSDLELEITEQRLVENLSEVENILNELIGQGIRIAIDDFGTGYSSLTYLAQLPAKVMKIDQSFLTAIEEDPRARRMANSIIAMGKALDFEIIAEGVETQAQQQFLETTGCHLGQGYGFARPQNAESIGPLLKASRISHHD